MAEWRPSLLPLGIPAPPAFMRSTGRKCQLWGLKKNVTEVCIQRAGVEKRQQMWHSPTHYSASDVWEEGGIKKCFPHPHSTQLRLPNSIQTHSRERVQFCREEKYACGLFTLFKMTGEIPDWWGSLAHQIFFSQFQKHQRSMTGYPIYLDP